ncbi:hypothetical protein A2U01_0002049 [Trifolium medium]|uniref:Uncharacterized protein n=1 Tax=Trifolium medium TaxID=97028 RepID=A0A392M4F2_9FABA|nr:hypothetical protein [Trifolium medium]
MGKEADEAKSLPTSSSDAATGIVEEIAEITPPVQFPLPCSFALITD